MIRASIWPLIVYCKSSVPLSSLNMSLYLNTRVLRKRRREYLQSGGGRQSTTQELDACLWGAVADGVKFKCLHCPGHTPGSISYYFEDHNLVCPGDTLFEGSIGRTRSALWLIRFVCVVRWRGPYMVPMLHKVMVLDSSNKNTSLFSMCGCLPLLILIFWHVWSVVDGGWVMGGHSKLARATIVGRN